ncbi:MAG: peptide-N-glycosidase F-related protein [Nonlabens sp.]|uniref:peptide-N-glycosidase F-related protein n=1 Tax=Nonlabens sp. TaxID=1888209 RepID=UPI003EF0B58E
MKAIKISLRLFCLILTTTLMVNCSSEKDGGSGSGTTNDPSLSASVSQLSFNDTQIDNVSALKIVNLTFANLTSDINLSATSAFELSLDGATFSNNLVFPLVNPSTAVFVRFKPVAVDNYQGALTIQNPAIANDIVINLSGAGTPRVQNVQTFSRERLAFGGGFSQSATQTFALPTDLSNVEAIKMYVKLTCPTGGCDEWDVFANVKVTDAASGEKYELARFITPYWNDNSQLPRGFEYDVTDFKSLLTGNAELRIFTECWNANGYEVSVDFDYIEGTPDFPYYAVSRLFNYDSHSLAGIPYGVAHSMDLTRTVSVPANSQSTHLRTVISGWGHATPSDAGGRTCAEWCYRTHNVLINGASMFQHDLAPLGCASNPVNNQSPGNWAPDRAGWCPGMEVPTRIDDFATAMAGSTFSFGYDLENWTNDGASNAFYAISTFVVVKSDTPISKPVVVD